MNNQLLSRFADMPVMVAPEMRNQFEACLRKADVMLDEVEARMATTAPAMQDNFWPAADNWLAKFRPYNVTAGILQVPVQGVLMGNFPYQFGTIATGYEYIQKALERGMADPEVQGIALIINSPGGAVSGNFDLVDSIYAMRGQKPIKAVANEHAYSAAYSIASAADEISVPRTGGLGSIGVVTMHVDMSGLIEDMGYKITFIHAGKHKVDGNPYEPLPDAVKARIQERIDASYNVFVSTVARNRGIDEKAVRDTEAQTFSAAESLSNKLADAIASLDVSLAAFAVDLNKKPGGTIMSNQKDEATVELTAADIAAATEAGRVEGRAEGAQTERARIEGIMALDESKNRHATALNIALKTDMTVEQAKEILATVPEAVAPAAAKAANNAFEDAMNRTDNPNLAADNDGAGEMSDKDKILAAAGRLKRDTK